LLSCECIAAEAAACPRPGRGDPKVAFIAPSLEHRSMHTEAHPTDLLSVLNLPCVGITSVATRARALAILGRARDHSCFRRRTGHRPDLDAHAARASILVQRTAPCVVCAILEANAAIRRRRRCGCGSSPDWHRGERLPSPGPIYIDSRYTLSQILAQRVAGMLLTKELTDVGVAKPIWIRVAACDALQRLGTILRHAICQLLHLILPGQVRFAPSSGPVGLSP